MIYLASPYSDKDPAVMKWRYEQAAQCTALLLEDGKFVYSPIVHCHELAQRYNLPREFDFWMRYNYHMLFLADMLYVLTIEGWQDSKGVTAEILYARQHDIPHKLVKIAQVDEGPVVVPA